jgi:hypothetical protein
VLARCAAKNKQESAPSFQQHIADTIITFFDTQSYIHFTLSDHNTTHTRVPLRYLSADD